MENLKLFRRVAEGFQLEESPVISLELVEIDLAYLHKRKEVAKTQTLYLGSIIEHLYSLL